MARNRHFVRGAAAISRKRETSWFGFPPAETGLAGSSVLVFTLTAAALALRPFTIVRTHVELSLRSDQAAAIERQFGGFGIAVVSDQAVAIGVTAVPTPITDSDSNLWLAHTMIFADESNLTDRTRSGTFKTIDSKAMRKVELGQDIIWVAEGSGAIGSGMTMGMGGRMLIKNH